MEAVLLSSESIEPFLKLHSGQFSLDLFIKGVRCEHCVYKISQEIEKNISIENYEFTSKGHRLKLWSHSRCALSEILCAIQSLGFEAVPVSDPLDVELEKRFFKKSLKQLAVAGVCAGNIMLFSTAVYLGADSEFTGFFHRLSFLLVLPVLFYSAQGIWYGFYQSLRKLRFNLDFPIGLALSMGFVLSFHSLFWGGEAIYFDSLAVVVFLVLSSRFVLNRYVEAIYQTNIVQFVPGVYQIRKVEEGREVWKALGCVKKGDQVKILKGETSPVDGKLLSLEALVDVYVLTGESKPEKLVSGDRVFAGTRLCVGEALVEVQQEGVHTRVGQLIKKALDSHSKQKEESFIWVSRFTTFVLLASLFTFVVLFFSIGIEEAFVRSFAIIIVACPCAVSFGIPLIRSFSGQLALQNGFIIKRPQVLDALLQASNFFFDKTGTLTPSRAKINSDDFHNLSKEDQDKLLSLESMMDHPISRGFHDLKGPANTTYKVDSFMYRPGLGLQGFIDGDRWEVQSHDQENKKKAVKILVNGMQRAIVGIETDIKVGLGELFGELVGAGKKISILSGDTSEQVGKIRELIPQDGRDQFLSGATPEQKLALIESSQQGSVMVGDGFNDLPAMKASHVSVCMPGALENNLNVADVTLTSGDVRRLPTLLKLARRVKATEKKLFLFTFLYNVSCVALAAFGYVSPVVAAILMPLSSITVLSLVVFNLRKL